MRRRLLLGALALTLAGCQSGILIVADTGGSVTSEDGVFTVVFPPGSLPEDTHISIRALPDNDWPVEAPNRFDRRIGAVYQLEPSGLQLEEDAYAVTLVASPDELRADDGGDIMAVHYVFSTSDHKVRPAPYSRTWHLADGRVAVVGTLYEIGTQWVGNRVPGAERSLPALTVHMTAEAEAEREVGTPWGVNDISIVSDLDHVLFERAVTAAVVRGPGDRISPTQSSGWTHRSWDATVDRELGMHPLEWFDPNGAARTEVISTFGTPEPVTLTAETALSPFTDELPSWTCDSAGEDAGSLWVGVDVVTGASEGVVHVGASWELGSVRCQ